MIVDRIENADLYTAISPRIAMALRALRDTDLASRAVGRYDLDGDKVFALVQHYDSKPAEKGIWESHRKYIDVQYVAAGEEKMGWAPIQTLTVTKPYEEDMEAALYSGKGSFVIVPPRSFAIFFPNDGHMPTIAIDKPGKVQKVVVKVAV